MSPSRRIRGCGVRGEKARNAQKVFSLNVVRKCRTDDIPASRVYVENNENMGGREGRRGTVGSNGIVIAGKGSERIRE
jgi:hypothetical protein